MINSIIENMGKHLDVYRFVKMVDEYNKKQTESHGYMFKEQAISKYSFRKRPLRNRFIGLQDAEKIFDNALWNERKQEGFLFEEEVVLPVYDNAHRRVLTLTNDGQNLMTYRGEILREWSKDNKNLTSIIGLIVSTGVITIIITNVDNIFNWTRDTISRIL